MPADSPGFEIVEFLWTFNMPTDHAHIRLTDVRVPHSTIFGGEGRGLGVVQLFFNENRIRQAASSLGAAEYCLDQAIEYAKARAPFGKPLAQNQGVQFPIVELVTQCEMLRAFIHKTSWEMDTYGAFSVSDKVSMCIGCHGIPGYKATFPELYHVPMIAGQNAKYIETALNEYKKGARSHPTMDAIAGSLSDQDIADLAAYYSNLK